MKLIKFRVNAKILLSIILFVLTALVSTTVFLLVEGRNNPDIVSLFDAVWFSIVAMSTTGYGDVIPSTIGGRIIALFTIILGVLATSLLTGTIASVYLNQISRSRSGLMSYNKVRGHVIICGWRENMDNFLMRILEKEQIPIAKIIVIADVEQALIDHIHGISVLKDFQYVRGSFFEKATLIKANITRAEKVIVLSDQTESRTPFEVDSRTVMAVISIKSLNKSIHVTAQLLERNFEIYLQRVKCDEIIFSKAINTELLSLIVHQNGMSNVISALLGSDVEDSCRINIEPISATYINKPFEEFESFYASKNPNTLVLGVLENTGKQHEIIDQAVRLAQKTADFPKMLENLRQVKDIKPYRPVLIPQRDYAILEYSSAILLEKKL